MNRTHTLAALALLVAVALAAPGCGGRGPRIVPVSGIVLIDGKPLPSGFVLVAPQGVRAATGKVGPDGRFTLTTSEPNDGCYTGTHPVAVIGTESIDGSSQRWNAPQKYASLEESGLTATIDGPTDQLKIEITWDGGKPFIQYFNAK